MAGVFVREPRKWAGLCKPVPRCRRNSGVASLRDTFGETTMNQPLLAALIAGAMMSFSFEAKAQERAGDAALGALSGAVVLGPVGAVAGAFIGYTAGPSIARSWGVRRSASSSRVRRASRGSATQGQATAIASAPPPVISAEAPPARQGTAPVQAAAKQGAPPVQALE